MAFDSLRSAQQTKKRRTSQSINLWRQLEIDGFASVSSTAATETISTHPQFLAQNITAQHVSHLGSGLRPVARSTPEMPSWRSTASLTDNLNGGTSSAVADGYSTNVKSPVQRESTSNNYVAHDILDPDIATNNGIFAIQPVPFPQSDLIVQRASTLLKHTADGVVAYNSLNEGTVSTEKDLCQAVLPPNDGFTVERASILSNYTADGAMTYPTLDHNVGHIFSHQMNLFPCNSLTVQRASTLTDYTADGRCGYGSPDHLFDEISPG